MAETGKRPALEAHAGRLADYAERSLQEFDAEAFRAGMEERIRARPIASVLIAAAAGFLLGRLLRS
ncbi:MAG: hypothetical protein FIB01_02180 [Gemmatimonadetes bacterium]|nr:hypothetical protein [Gemmatimonadota bacterium]